MSETKAAAIEQKLIEVLQSKGAPEEAEKLIKDAKEGTDADEWDIRKVLWRLTADGKAVFTPGFRKVFLS
jgi:hypothetical protein